jgi:heme a synthase
MVTSTSSGLSVPDWPTTYGYSMFSFPLSSMVGGIFYEHGHRLIASTVGFLTIGLVVLLTWREPRRWVRRLGWYALAAVVLQGVLGGLTVLLLLPAAVSIGHAALAQIFFCLTVSIALVTSPAWRHAHESPRYDANLRLGLIALTVLVYGQILLGATMRHLGAGLAIPDFPLSFGHLIPPAFPFPVAVHFAHRVGALLVSLAAIAAAGHVIAHYRRDARLVRTSVMLLVAIAAQVTLGALVVLSARQPIVNTAHVATGALVLATSLVLTLQASRERIVSA